MGLHSSCYFQFLTVKMQNILWFSITSPGIKPCWVQAQCGHAASGAAPCHRWFWWCYRDLWSQWSPFSQFFLVLRNAIAFVVWSAHNISDNKSFGKVTALSTCGGVLTPETWSQIHCSSGVIPTSLCCLYFRRLFWSTASLSLEGNISFELSPSVFQKKKAQP